MVLIDVLLGTRTGTTCTRGEPNTCTTDTSTRRRCSGPRGSLAEQKIKEPVTSAAKLEEMNIYNVIKKYISLNSLEKSNHQHVVNKTIIHITLWNHFYVFQQQEQ